MRVVQMIDSLESGGAERMAVTIANELVGQVSFSGLLSTRIEGNLKSAIDKEVYYLFLNRCYVIRNNKFNTSYCSFHS